MSSAINSQIWNAKAANVQNADGSPFYVTGTWAPSVAGGTITAATGTLTTVTVTDARYTRIGRLVTATLDITIVDKGTGAGELLIAAPIAIAKRAAGSAIETGATGFGGRVFASPSGSLFSITKTDYTTLIVNTYRICATVTYES